MYFDVCTVNPLQFITQTNLVLTMYEILLIYIYIYCALVCLDNNIITILF